VFSQSVRVMPFQPFSSRKGVDTVLGLHFDYDPGLVALLKEALQGARWRTGRRNVGGWLPEWHRWFVERVAWPHVRQRLLEAGCRVLGDCEDEDGGEDQDQGQDEGPDESPGQASGASVTDWGPVIRTWYRTLCLKFHPDRGGSTEQMQAINAAHDELRRLVGDRA
jgi:hypothetical protein